MIYSDKTLSQKLERTEARANADFVEARAEMFPASGAAWIEVAVERLKLFGGGGRVC